MRRMKLGGDDRWFLVMAVVLFALAALSWTEPANEPYFAGSVSERLTFAGMQVAGGIACLALLVWRARHR